MAWASSTRAAELPRDWPRRRRKILARDPVCQACGTNPSTEVDHIGDRDDHDPANLRGLCRGCHARKTTRQALEARRAYWAARQRGRPPEPHPGSTQDRSAGASFTR